jgi:transposase InsO family protein
MLKDETREPGDPPEEDGQKESVKTKDSLGGLTSKYPNHIWLVDLTTFPTGGGFWAPWLPLALPQIWPFCWWIACAVDHYSRSVVGVTLFKKPPTSVEVRTFLGRSMSKVGASPKYIVCDKGGQFWNPGFKRWCKRRSIDPRYGAVGQYGSIAIVERFIRSLKEEGLRRILIPLRLEGMRRELSCYVSWFNTHRLHQSLGGRTPSEVYEGRTPANEMSRFEPRARWPQCSLCAEPQARVKGKPGVRLALVVTLYGGRRHLPVVRLEEAA